MGTRKNKIIFTSLIICLLAILSWWILKSPAKAQIQYRVIQPESRDLITRVQTTGSVQPENRVEIKPTVAGRVEEVLVSEGQYVKKGTLLAWMSSAERAALIDAARAKGEAELNKWRELYKPTPVIAPVSGNIIHKKVESGQSVNSQDAILVMADRLIIKATVDETDMSKIKKNQVAEVSLDAYPKELFNARVSAIAYEAEKTNNVTTYSVDVLAEQNPDYMRSGMTANISFISESKAAALSLPTEAIKFKQGKSFVLTGNQAEPTETDIAIGLTDGKYTEIVNGITLADKVYLEDLNLEQKSNGTNPFMPARWQKKDRTKK